MTWQIWDSSWMMIWVLRAIRAEKSVGRPMASSKELVCRDWVPPRTADMASRVVRMTLLYGSCSVRLQPEVWQWVRSIEDLRILRVELAHQSVPEETSGPQHGDIHEEIHADAEEEGQPRGKGIDIHARSSRPP